MLDLTAAVDYVLANRYRMGNRVAIAFLALVRERPSPKRRVQWDRLGMLFGASHRSYVSALLREMKRLDLIEYDPGVINDTGYLFHRVGPPPDRAFTGKPPRP